MPVDPATASALIAGGAQTVGNIANVISTIGTNKKARKHSEKMWHMQNEYNHPSSQMARLREAGLNPNLVYGKGADNTAQSVSIPRAEAPRVEMDARPVLSAYYDTQMKMAQIDNLRVQNSVLEQDKALKAAQIVATLATTQKTGVDTRTGEFDLQMKNTMAETSMELMREQVRKLKADTDYTLDQNERAALQNVQSLQEGVERILNMRSQRATDKETRDNIRQQIENLKKDGIIKDLDIQLKRMGIQPTDALWQRVVGRIIGDPAKVGERIKKAVDIPGPVGQNPIKDFMKLFD